ncbi:hypothetical protein GCM10010428_50640 [Actinosynnema pretiosum subsp. pretiosum]
MIAEWTRQEQARRAEAMARLAALPAVVPRMSEGDIRHVIDRLGDVRRVLRAATAVTRAEGRQPGTRPQLSPG